jgi:hypothetical protein
MIDGLFLPGQLVQFGGGILPTVLLSDTPAAEYSFNLTSGDSGLRLQLARRYPWRWPFRLD